MRYVLSFALLLVLAHPGYAQNELPLDPLADEAQDSAGTAGAAAEGEPGDGAEPDAGADAEAGDGDSAAADESGEEASEGEGAAGDEASEDEDSGSDSDITFWDRVDEITSSGAIGLIREGGLFMYPILLFGVIALGVIIERYRSLKMLSTDTTAVRSQVQNLLEHDRFDEAVQLCDDEQGPVPAILSEGIRKLSMLKRLNYDPGRIEAQVIKSMEDYSVHIVAALERHLPILATISSVAPMLGFLGTVSGMITSFKDIVATMGETNIVEAAAAGISEALLTTCFGLIIGIPAFIAFNYFTGVINRFVLDVEESATELVEVVTAKMAIEQRGTA